YTAMVKLSSRSFYSASVLTLILSTGCGGGTGGSDSGGGHFVSQLGGLQVAYKGAQIQPLISSPNPNISVTTMAGATFSNATYAAAKDVSQTLIAYGRLEQIWGVSPSGYNPQAISSFFAQFYGVPEHPSWSTDGRLAFDRYTSGIGKRITTLNGDGTSLLTITSGPQDTLPAWAPNNARI